MNKTIAGHRARMHMQAGAMPYLQKTLFLLMISLYGYKVAAEKRRCEFSEASDGENGNYARNRMYDPASGSFTQQDPMRWKDNWYGYCQSDPIDRQDRWGLWDSAVHFDDVLVWAQQCGFTPEEALVIAQADINVDYTDKNGTVTDNKYIGAIDNPQFHFNMNYYNDPSSSQTERDSRFQLYTYYFQQAVQLLQAGLRQDALTAFGKGLHALQDMWAHLDEYVDYYSNYGHPNHIWATVLAAMGLGVNPDSKYENTAGYRHTVQVSFDALEQFKREWDKNDGQENTNNGTQGSNDAGTNTQTNAQNNGPGYTVKTTISGSVQGAGWTTAPVTTITQSSTGVVTITTTVTLIPFTSDPTQTQTTTTTVAPTNPQDGYIPI